MSRIRAIKPEFFLHDGLAELSPAHRLLFIGLWTLADRDGRLEDRPKRIKAQLFPWDDLGVDAMLSDLDSAGFVQRYESDGVACISIPGFQEHQRPHPKETSFQLPAPPAVKKHGKPGKETASREKDSTCRVVVGDGDGCGCGDGCGATAEPAVAGERVLELVEAPSAPQGPLPDDLRKIWNELKPAACPAAASMSKQRHVAAAARIREHQPDPLVWWRSILAAVNESSFLRGERGEWRADFDWLLKPANLIKVGEGKYRDVGPKPARTPANAISDEAKEFHATHLGIIHDF